MLPDYQRLVLLSLALMVALAACDSPGSATVAPCKVTISSQSAQALITRIGQNASVRGRNITITATNDEVSSLLGQYLEQVKRENPNDVIPISTPVTCFQNGKMTIFAQVQWGTNNNVDGVITLGATAVAGKPEFKVEQITLGPVSVPPDLSAEVSRLINKAVSEYLTQITVSEIKMQNGVLTLTGQVKS